MELIWQVSKLKYVRCTFAKNYTYILNFDIRFVFSDLKNFQIQINIIEIYLVDPQ